MGTPETVERDEPRPESRGIDGLMTRYSRWRRQRLVTLTEVPLSTLTLRTLALSGFILVDGVLLPWVVTVLEGTFSFLLFAILFVPLIAAEAMVYRRMKRPPQTRT